MSVCQRPWSRLLVALLVCMFLGCLLVPPIVAALRALGIAGDYTVSRIARRVFMILGIIGFLSQARHLGLPSPAEAGLRLHHGARRNFAIGGLVGFASIWLLSIGKVYFGHCHFLGGTQVAEWALRILAGLCAAAVISAIEEYLIRGALLSALRRHMSLAMAVAVCSAIFASLHFFQGGAVDYDPETLRWFSGFLAAGSLVAGMTTELDLVSFLGIFLVGVVLCLATVKTGSLFLPLGLHFGWVLYIKTLGEEFKRIGSKTVWVGGSQVYDGLIGPLMLLVLIVPLVLFLLRVKVLRQAPE